MILIFAAPYLIWRLGRTDYYAPLVVVQIIVNGGPLGVCHEPMVPLFR